MKGIIIVGVLLIAGFIGCNQYKAHQKEKNEELERVLNGDTDEGRAFKEAIRNAERYSRGY